MGINHGTMNLNGGDNSKEDRFTQPENSKIHFWTNAMAMLQNLPGEPPPESLKTIAVEPAVACTKGTQPCPGLKNPRLELRIPPKGCQQTTI